MGRAFTDKAHRPGDADLERVLGGGAKHWKAFLRALEAEHGPLSLEWKFYGGASAGWTLKVLRGARNLFFVIPQEGHFVIAFVLGDKAVAAAEASPLPAAILTELTTAKRYAEGRGVRLAVTTPADIPPALLLARLKASH